jgi:Cep192 domain 4/HYDIN/CFA65/VesB-like, Ig-like domain
MEELRTRQTSRGDLWLSPARCLVTTSLRGLAVAAALLALLGSAGCIGLTGSSPLAPSGAGDISVTPSPLEFGKVVVGTTNSHPVTLSNTTKVDLTIKAVAISGKGFAASGIPTPFVLGAGQSADFTASFKPAAAGAASGNISIESNLAAMSVSLSGTGVTSAPQLSTSTSAIGFGNVTLGTPSTQPLVLKNTGNANLEIGTVSASGAGFTESGSNFNLAPNQSFTVSVTFDPKTTGSVTGTLSISSNSINSNSTSVKLSGAGVTAQTVRHSVALNWRPSASAVVGYFVYRGTISGGPYTKLVASLDTVPSYTDGTVSGGKIYYYVVTSVDANNIESAFSNQVSAAIPSP